MSDDRPDWDTYFMRFAHLAAKRSTCTRRQVGAVIVKDHQILATGYNGSPSGQPHCTDDGCLMDGDKCVRTIHGEQNAILQAARRGIAIEGAAIYTTSRPCHVCSRLIAGSGITVVFYDTVSGDLSGKSKLVLENAGVNTNSVNCEIPYVDTPDAMGKHESEASLLMRINEAIRVHRDQQRLYDNGQIEQTELEATNVSLIALIARELPKLSFEKREKIVCFLFGL